MSGAAALLLLSLCQVFAYDEIQPPQELHITVPTLGIVHLSWKHSVTPQNKTVRYNVNISTPEDTYDITTSQNYSTRYLVALHRGFTAHVATEIYDLPYDGFSMPSAVSKWLSKSLPPYPGADGTAAWDLSCWIDIEASRRCFLRCVWAPGDAAPEDTEYSLYYRYNDVIEKCQDYLTEPRGRRRTGCRILSSAISPQSNNYLLVHINGTSKSLKIKATEKKFLVSNIEVIPPVQNLTLNASGLHWIKPLQTFKDDCLQYEVNIWSKRRNDTVTVTKSSYLREDMQKSAHRQFIRVRAVGTKPCWTINSYSLWTDIIHMGEGVDRSDILGIIVTVCLIVACIVIFLLCVKFWGYIFPQIPKPKNDLKEAFQNIQSQGLMRCNSWDNEEVISYIEEIVESNKYKTSPDYGHIADYSTSRLCKPL